MGIVFYLLPLLLTKDTGGAMFSILILIPLLMLVISCIYGMKNGFHKRYALIVALLFIPSIYVIYNESAWIYTAIYGALVLIGNLIGLALRKTKNTDWLKKNNRNRAMGKVLNKFSRFLFLYKVGCINGK